MPRAMLRVATLASVTAPLARFVPSTWPAPMRLELTAAGAILVVVTAPLARSLAPSDLGALDVGAEVMLPGVCRSSHPPAG